MVEEGHLEFSLRSFLIKLSVSKPLSKVLPQGNCYKRWYAWCFVYLFQPVWIWPQNCLFGLIKFFHGYYSDPIFGVYYLSFAYHIFLSSFSIVQAGGHTCVYIFYLAREWNWLVTFYCLTGCRWEITAYFRSLPQVNTSKDAELWIPTDTKQWQQPPLITPIKSMSSDSLSVQLYLENPSLLEENL